MPELRHGEHAMQAELQSIVNQVDDRAAYLRLAETMSAFLTRLRTSADSLDVEDGSGSSASCSGRGQRS